MSANTRICLYKPCSSKFIPHHGNQLYCSPECKDAQKALTQGIQYGVLKKFRKGFLANYKIFENLLADGKPKDLPLTELEIMGFNYNCFYGEWEDDKGNILCLIANYRFYMYYIKEEPFVKLIKA